MNTSSISVPLLYKWTEPAEGNVQQSLQAFVMQLSEYLLLRAFLFFLLRKHYVLIPDNVSDSVAAKSATSESTTPEIVSVTPTPESPTMRSPVPLAPKETPSVMTPETAIAASRVLGVAVDESGDDLELQKTKNYPSIAVNQTVEISRVNRYLPCNVLSPGSAASQPTQTMYLAIGRSQLSLLSMVRGSLKDAVVQLVFSLYELLDICIEDTSRRTVSIFVAMGEGCDGRSRRTSR